MGRLAREPLPAPREVNRFYTLAEDKLMEEMSVPFPSPLEVDRELYETFGRRSHRNRRSVSDLSRGR